MQDRIFTETHEKIKNNLNKLKTSYPELSTFISYLETETNAFFNSNDLSLMNLGECIRNCNHLIVNTGMRYFTQGEEDKFEPFLSILTDLHDKLADQDPKELAEEDIRTLISNALQNRPQDENYEPKDIEIKFLTNDDSFPKIAKHLSAGQAYFLAHQLGNHILALSKTKNKSDIKVKLDVCVDDHGNCNGFKVIIPDEGNNIQKLHDAQNNSLKKTEYSFITQLIARLVAPYTPKKYAKIIDRINASNNNRFEDIFAIMPPQAKKMDVYTSNGSYLDTLKIETNNPEKKDTYILHCSGNSAIYQELISDFTKHDANVVLFGYPGYGLSLGEVNTKVDLYDSAVHVAKKLIDDGAKYILVDGVSLGGAVAAKIAATLQKYCRDSKRDIQIEHFNSMSFASTKKFAQGFVEEFNGPQRSKPGIFRKVISTLLSPFISLFLKAINWDMNPKKNIKRLYSNSYEIISAKGDFVMGEGPSNEKQFREQNKVDILKLKNQLTQLQKQENPTSQIKIIKHLIYQKEQRLLKPMPDKGSDSLNLLNQDSEATSKDDDENVIATSWSNSHSATIDHLEGASEKYRRFLKHAPERKSLFLDQSKQAKANEKVSTYFSPKYRCIRKIKRA